MNEPTEQTTDDFMHIYGQVSHHADALIVGTLSAIQLLRDACDRAIATNGKFQFDTFSSDGEGYETTVRIVADLDALDALPTQYIDYGYTATYIRTQATNDALDLAAAAVESLWSPPMGVVGEACNDVLHRGAELIRKKKVPT